MQLLTLLLLSQHPIYDGLPTTVMQELLGVPNQSTGEISADYFWPPEKYSYTVDAVDQSEFERGRIHFQDTFSPSLQPVLVVEDKGKLYFVMHESQLKYYLSHWYACPDCYPSQTLGGKFAARLGEPLKLARERGWVRGGDVYNVVVEKVSLWPSRQLTWGELMRRGRAPWTTETIYLRPDMLIYVRLHMPSDTDHIGEPNDMVPAWVTRRLHGNRHWIAAARSRLGELTWVEFYRTHGYIPGDRTVSDMIYNFKLRDTVSATETIRRLTWGTRCEPEVGPRGFGPGGRYTACAEALWTEERDAAAREVVEMNEVCDVYAGDK